MVIAYDDNEILDEFECPQKREKKIIVYFNQRKAKMKYRHERAQNFITWVIVNVKRETEKVEWNISIRIIEIGPKSEHAQMIKNLVWFCCLYTKLE